MGTADDRTTDFDECIAHIREYADYYRFGNEVWLNVKMTTLANRLGIPYYTPAVGDLEDITNKYRKLGVID